MLLAVSIIDSSSSLDVFESSSNASSESLYVSASAIDDCSIPHLSPMLQSQCSFVHLALQSCDIFILLIDSFIHLII